MNNKFNNLKSRKYLLLFIFVMVLNISLTIILIRVSFSQAKKEDFSSQQPVSVNVMEQKDCPLQIVIVNVDNSALSYQNIIYSLQNIGSKPIRACVLLGDGKHNGRIITSFFSNELFQTGKYHSSSLPLERETIEESGTVSLSIDYVEFADGSSWGSDSQKKSIEIDGQREGVKVAIKQLKDSIKNQSTRNANSIKNLLEKDIKEIEVDMPNTNPSDEWKKGFRGGYKSIIFTLQREKEQKAENLIKKLDEMEKIAN